MKELNPYLNFNGNAEEAFNFYKSVFGGEFEVFSRFKDAPAGNAPKGDEGERILHVSLPIGRNNALMGSDIPEHYGKAVMGTNFSISINTDNENETDKLFNALAEGGKVTMPLGKTFWNSYFGMLTDKFGIQWMISNELAK